MKIVSQHAKERYIERFAGNITEQHAETRILKMFKSAKYKRSAPGKARIYQTHGIEFVVHEKTILTLYLPDKPKPYAEQA